MNEKKVWISFIDTSRRVKDYGVYTSFTQAFDYKAFYKLEQEWEKNKKDKNKLAVIEAEMNVYRRRANKLSDEYKSFKPLTELPDSLWLGQKPYPGKRAYMFWISDGFIILNQACAEVLKPFNLGKTTLTPLKLYDVKTQQSINDDDVFYFLNVAEQREYVTEKQPAHEFLKYDKSDRDWSYSVSAAEYLGDVRINVDRSATKSDLDLWHDPHLKGERFFMSDRLRTALIDAKLDKLWQILPCELV